MSWPLTAGALLCAAVSAGCWSAPTPLAPSLRGSVGVPHKGVLTGAAKLPENGAGYKRLRNDKIQYGNPRLVAAIERAAKRVKELRPDGAPLVIADLSAENGGKIPRHRSHRSGRDADLLFYVRTPDGRSVENTGFFRFKADGIALVDKQKKQFVMIDLDRTWIMVQAFTEDSEAMMQWLFVARWLEALLVEHALAIGAPEEVIRRAQYLLRQPGDSAAHDDHFHIRIACSPGEAVAGCRGGGYHWSWLPKPPAPKALSDDALIALMMR